MSGKGEREASSLCTLDRGWASFLEPAVHRWLAKKQQKGNEHRKEEESQIKGIAKRKRRLVREPTEEKGCIFEEEDEEKKAFLFFSFTCVRPYVYMYVYVCLVDFFL